MRLLIYTHEYFPSLGGVQTYCREMAVAAASLGQEVKVLTLEPEEQSPEDGVAVSPFTVCRLPAERKNDPAAVLATIEQYRPHLVHAADWQGQMVLSDVVDSLAIPVIVTAYAAEIPLIAARPAWKDKMVHLYQRAWRIVAISRYTRDLLASYYGLPPASITVIPVGVNVPRLAVPKQDPSRWRERWHLGPEQPVILTLARLVPRKGQDMVIRALPRVLEQVPEAIYVVAGEGEYLPRLQELAASLGVQEKVIFTGRVPQADVVAIYDLGRVYVMPSRPEGASLEGFGMTYLEAGMRELPVIGGRHGGVTEAVIDGYTGLLVDPFNVEDIAGTITRLLVDTELARRLGRNGRQRAEEEFDFRLIARKTYHPQLHASLHPN